MCGCWIWLRWNSFNLGVDSQMLQAKDVKSPNSHAIVTVNLDENPSTSGVDIKCFVHLWQRSIYFMCSSTWMKFWSQHVLIEVLASSFSILDWRNYWRNALLNSRCIFGLQPNITIFIIIWIKFGTYHKSLHMLLECFIKSFVCEIHISC
jgi:hypothetical protein